MDEDGIKDESQDEDTEAYFDKESLDGVSESVSESDDEQSEDSTEHVGTIQEKSEAGAGEAEDATPQIFHESIDSQYFLDLFDELDVKSAYWAQLISQTAS
jgi:hypothetical protein